MDAGSKDAGAPAPDAGTPPPPTDIGWLRTQGNKVVDANGTVFHMRGVNLPDTRSCNACAYETPHVDEVTRRGDVALGWGANLIRLGLECYAAADGRVHYACVDKDPLYLADIQTIVHHFVAQGAYVLLSEVVDPTYDVDGWPTAGTNAHLRTLATAFANEPHVLFGVGSEPMNNFSGSDCTQGPDCNANCWSRFNAGVQAIRDAEKAAGATHQHLVTVSGVGGWARLIGYYVTHPITAGGGTNVLYETHSYSEPGVDYITNKPCTALGVGSCLDMYKLWSDPAKTLPVIIGEFGNSTLAEGAEMSLTAMTTMVHQAEALDIPWTIWTMHQRCDPNLLVDHSSWGCGVGMQLELSPSGIWVMDRLSRPYGAP